MAIVPQHATATADADGDAVFSFPDVPQGELWCGTTSIPGAPSTAVGMVTTGGQLVGATYGPGSYGPWIADYSQKLAISVTGLTPGVQYVAVWHADDKGTAFSTYPAPITSTVAGEVTIPTPLEIFGTVTANQGDPPWEVDVTNFPATQPVSGTVTAEPVLAGAVGSGQVSMTGSAVTLPAHAAVQGVVLSAPSANAHPITLGASGFVMEPGQTTPLLPVTNSNLFSAVGTSGDLLSFLVI